jgi:cyanate lyase
MPPTDPTMYRIYEVLQVCGTPIKALIHEEFGDGIMRAPLISVCPWIAKTPSRGHE